MRDSNRPVFVGVRGSVLGLDRATGSELWRARLKGYDFVNVVLEGSDLLAATKGEIFCLDPTTGHIRWHNRLKGFGLGIVAIGSTSGQGAALSVEKKRRDEERAAAAAASGS